MTFHLVSLPHTETTVEYLGCAYTQKVVKFCRMMMARGHEVVLYAGEENEAPCTEHVMLLDSAEREAVFGAHDPAVLPDWPSDTEDELRSLTNDWDLFNRRAAKEIDARASQSDFVLVPGGYSQRSIFEDLPSLMVVEPFVGYEGIHGPHVAFESYAWQHYVYAKKGIIDGRYFDAVIPNYFDPDEFIDRTPWRASGDPYLLFIGRLVQRKGLGIAADIARAAEMQLVVAGAGATSWGNGMIEAPEVTVTGNLHYAGPVNVGERSRLMHGAHAVLVPTTYIEPFGGVAVEAMMCGTPAIATDWGAFTETVPDMYRFRTLARALEAVEAAHHEDRMQLAIDTRALYGLEGVAPMFEEWFDSLSTLWGDGWYTISNQEAVTA